jgi:hypothetical protein
LITCTGWTWDHIDERVTLPQVAALGRFWKQVPPPAVQLRRIALFLGLKPESAEATPNAPRGPMAPTNQDDALRALGVSGLPIMRGRPDDPMLDLLDLP